jgi:hypothetical protein
VPSNALQSLLTSLEEIEALQRANPSPTGSAPSRPDVTRAIGRASVVLLSGHLERYLRNVNEEATSVVNGAGVLSDSIPTPLRLLNLRDPIDQLAALEWTERRAALESLMRQEASLWRSGEVVRSLDHRRLLTWMSAPTCAHLRRFYRQWGIVDIFTSITRKPHTRSRLWLTISALVDKRNNIAHGDFGEEATQADIRQYVVAVTDFCRRADRAHSRQLGRISATPRPW